MVKFHGESALIYRLDFEALSELEQTILFVLFSEKKALQAWEIYKDLIIVLSKKKPEDLNRGGNRAVEITHLAFAFIAFVLLHSFMDKKKLEKEGVEYYAAERRKQGAAIPSFPKVQRTVLSLKKEGILKKRQVNGKVYYSLNDFVKEQLAKRFVIP